MKALSSAASKAGKAAAEAAKQVDDKYGIKDKVKGHTASAKAKVVAVPAAERQKYFDTASVVLSTASLIGGPQTKLAAAAAGAASTIHKMHSFVTPAGETSVFQVTATQPEGGEMTIALESGEFFQVTVPPGVQPGDLFQVELPVSQSAGGGASSARPGSSMMAAVSAAAGAAATSAATAAAAKSLGVSPAQAKAGMQVAGDLGLTPAETLQVGMKGMKIASDLGVTPAQVAKAGAMASKMAR